MMASTNSCFGAPHRSFAGAARAPRPVSPIKISRRRVEPQEISPLRSGRRNSSTSSPVPTHVVDPADSPRSYAAHKVSDPAKAGGRDHHGYDRQPIQPIGEVHEFHARDDEGSEDINVG